MTKENKISQDKAYVVTVDMGYGHQRAVYPLTDIAAAPEGWDGTGANAIITANNYAGIPKKDRNIWEGGRSLYEKISRMKHLPIVGDWIFGAMDYYQRIEPFYPKHDLGKATTQLKQLYSMIDKGWGKHLIDVLNENPLPMINSFFTTAFFADEHGYKGDIYCLCTDADVSRAWAPLNPKKSRIKYLAPTQRVKERLKLYGVLEKNIITTGFPLPEENIGKDAKILKTALGQRLCALDPQMHYHKKYEETIEHYLGTPYCRMDRNHPLTITFAVGGAGAQREIGATILTSLRKKISAGEVRLNLVAGARNDVYRYYSSLLSRLRLKNKKKFIHIIYDKNKLEYFKKFNIALNETDILWTKPSELSFYSGLGLPIVIAPTIGSQEEFNKKWLLSTGAGFEQEDPRYTDQWLFDWINSGWLAEAAMEGFLDAPSAGNYRIRDVVFRGIEEDITGTQII